MKDNNLHLSETSGFRLLTKWVNKIEKNEKHLEIQLNKNYPPGEGKTVIDKSKSLYQIIVGCNIPKTFPLNLLPIEDRNFVKIGVTLFHEVDHYQQHTKEHIKECLLSELSKYNNDSYYKESWHELPHEIHAEYSGVMTMWEVMEQEFTLEQADACMLDYINQKADHTRYIIPPAPEGYQSKTEVEHAFEEAYERSLTKVRKFQPNFLRYKDEASRLLTDDGILRIEYQRHYHTLIGNIPGEQKDRLMSSLVVHLHPELQEEYPALEFHGLSIKQTFHLPAPETTEEARQRVLQEENKLDFKDAIEHLSYIEMNEVIRK